MNPQLTASSGTLNGVQVWVWPARTSASAFSHEVEGEGGGVGLEVAPGPVPLEGVGPLRDLPLEGDFGLRHRPRQVDEHRVTGRLGVAAVSTRPPRAVAHRRGERATTGVGDEVVLAVEPAGRHRPAVGTVPVALLRPGDRVLVPGVTPVDRVPERVPGHEHLLVLPVLVERVTEEDADAEVDVDQVVGDELAVDDDAGADEGLAAPVGHVPVLEVAVVGVVETHPRRSMQMRRWPTAS